MIQKKIENQTAYAGVIGLGYVGLPLAVTIAKAGFSVTGIDVDRRKVKCIRNGISVVSDVPSEDLASFVHRGQIQATTDYRILRELDTINICVPTPLRKSKDPDMSFIISAVDEIAQYLRKDQLIILESTTYPGTTEEVVLPKLEKSGLQVGKDFFLAFSPERIDPGNRQYGLRETPRVVGGETVAALDLARQFYAQCGVTTVPVASVEVAELTKVFENTFRFVNISLVNELAQIATALNVSAWEVLEAASTKPYGFMPHEPGPGVGGSCIPVIPFFLADVAERLGTPSHLIAAAERVNTFMPQYVTDRAAALVGRRDGDLAGCHILVLGVTYKPDQSDCRHSPAVPVVDRLIAAGATVRVHDPRVTEVAGLHPDASFAPLTAEVVGAADLVVVITPHRSLDYGLVLSHARCILDTRNALRDRAAPNVVPL